MVFDRDGLRVLRAAYELALRRLRQVELLSESERERLAGAILELGWARTCRGLSLRGAETLIASEAFSHHKDASALALCA